MLFAYRSGAGFEPSNSLEHSHGKPKDSDF
jgi:hypothetical protein